MKQDYDLSVQLFAEADNIEEQLATAHRPRNLRQRSFSSFTKRESTVKFSAQLSPGEFTFFNAQ